MDTQYLEINNKINVLEIKTILTCATKKFFLLIVIMTFLSKLLLLELHSWLISRVTID